MADYLLVRVVFLAALSAVAYFLRPFDLSSPVALGVGVAVAAALIAAEARLRRESSNRIAGAAVGVVAGLVASFLFALVLGQAFPGGAPVIRFAEVAALAASIYWGAVLGAENFTGFRSAGTTSPTAAPFLALDTSVIIDGRIADICETGFVDGHLAVPRFVMRELQAVADSSDGAKRNRGRRGLDILQRIQKLPRMEVRILEDDFPNVPEVDLKLLELAKRYGCKIVTNDFNLNKVAQVHKVAVLNVNELANALKPVVLPGEWMRVYILKEGKEAGQGVAYLDDGTMVVVDNARRLIGRTIDISVTSVLQTTAGKMIFARFDDRQHAIHDVKEPLRAVAPAASS